MAQPRSLASSVPEPAVGDAAFCYVAGEHLQQHYGTLQHVFMAGLQDSSVEVRRTALEAVGTIALWVELEQDVKLFQRLMPVALQVPFAGCMEMAAPHLKFHVRMHARSYASSLW